MYIVDLFTVSAMALLWRRQSRAWSPGLRRRATLIILSTTCVVKYKIRRRHYHNDCSKKDDHLTWKR